MSFRFAAQRVVNILRSLGLEVEVREFSQSTKTSAEAAQAIGTTIAQIAKSLVFMAEKEPILAIASGANRVDTEKLSALVGKKVRRANADEVKEATGFIIGGVAPVGHPRKLPVYIDEDLMPYTQVWAAAGTPYSVFAITPQQLLEVTSGKVADIKE